MPADFIEASSNEASIALGLPDCAPSIEKDGSAKAGMRNRSLFLDFEPRTLRRGPSGRLSDSGMAGNGSSEVDRRG
jgi:hypothetical protein